MWIIVIIAIIILVYLGELFLYQLDLIGLFFDKTYLTIFATLSAFVSAVYFWASSKSYTDYKLKDKFMELIKLHQMNQFTNEKRN